jgi:rhomboid family protein
MAAKPAQVEGKGDPGGARFGNVIPYKDENPAIRPPLVTVGIIVLNVLVWLLLESAGSGTAVASAACRLGLIPGEVLRTLSPGTRVPLGRGLVCVTETPHYATIFTSMFVHGGWLHLIGNMWFLWVFGNNIEDSMGHARFVVFYLVCGVAAALTQMLTNAHARVPMIGASGAISGVMGAYILLYPRVRVHTLLFLGFFVTTVALPAYIILGYWFVLQLLLGTVGSVSQAEGGVAFWAHVGGFLAGLTLIRGFASPALTARRKAPEAEPWWDR